MSNDVDLAQVIDPDVDLRVRRWRRELAQTHGAILAVISVGGGLGAAARYGLSQAFPGRAGHFPWATFATNVLGSFLIGVLMVLILEVWSAHRLLRPFLGVGFLGGFTTFATYAVETLDLLRPGTVWVAFVYLAATAISAVLAVVLGAWVTRAATQPLHSRERV